MILLDTSVLSLAFRRRSAPRDEEAPVAALRRLIDEDAALAVPGIVYQELLSGLKTPAHASRLERLLSGFPVVLATREDHAAAARLFATCRRAGVVASAIDALIAAQCIRRRAALFTTDRDFERMAKYTNLALHDPGAS